MTSLCASCAVLALTAADFTGPPPPSNDADCKKNEPQTLSYAKANTNCTLCQLIWYAIDATRGEWEREVVADNEVYYHFKLMLYRFPISGTPFMTLDIRTQFPFYGPSYGIQLLPVGTASTQRSLVGRSLSSSNNFLPRVRFWILKCVESHGASCEHTGLSRLQEIQEEFYLVNVEQRCIVQAAIEVKYLALSYVWGRIDQPTLVTANVEQLQRPGSLADIHASLPRTVQDAMALTKDLGEQYLWADTLCIIQDDDAFKSRIINQMNAIYQNAYLTIIAATGSDANAGIFGADDSARSQPAAFINEDLTLIYAPSHQKLAQSPWATRGWT